MPPLISAWLMVGMPDLPARATLSSKLVRQCRSGRPGSSHALHSLPAGLLWVLSDVHPIESMHPECPSNSGSAVHGCWWACLICLPGLACQATRWGKADLN